MSFWLIGAVPLADGGIFISAAEQHPSLSAPAALLFLCKSMNCGGAIEHTPSAWSTSSTPTSSQPSLRPLSKPHEGRKWDQSHQNSRDQQQGSYLPLDCGCEVPPLLIKTEAHAELHVEMQLQVADFGLSRIKESAQLKSSRAGLEGTIEYAAPEVSCVEGWAQGE